MYLLRIVAVLMAISLTTGYNEISELRPETDYCGFIKEFGIKCN